MSESQFKFRREEEEPLFLDSHSGSDDRVGSPAGLYLDRDLDRAPVRTRRREGGRFPLILASVIVFLLAAGVAAFVLEPPAVLREWVASVTGAKVTPEAPPPAPAPAAEVKAAPPVPTPVDAATAAAAQEAAAAAAETPPLAPEVSAKPAPEPEAKAAEPPPKPKATAKHKATAKSKPAVKPKPPVKKIAPPPKKSLDLDALERSLN
jgi:hypothetical protein